MPSSAPSPTRAATPPARAEGGSQRDPPLPVELAHRDEVGTQHDRHENCRDGRAERPVVDDQDLLFDQTSTPSIWPDVPPRMAGVTNDPAVSEKTSVQPTVSPGRLSGKVTRRKGRQAVAPRVRGASSSRGSILPSAEASGSTIIGKNT